jgi:hypothetical protein
MARPQCGDTPLVPCVWTRLSMSQPHWVFFFFSVCARHVVSFKSWVLMTHQALWVWSLKYSVQLLKKLQSQNIEWNVLRISPNTELPPPLPHSHHLVNTMPVEVYQYFLHLWEVMAFQCLIMFLVYNLGIVAFWIYL